MISTPAIAAFNVKAVKNVLVDAVVVLPTSAPPPTLEGGMRSPMEWTDKERTFRIRAYRKNRRERVFHCVWSLSRQVVNSTRCRGKGVDGLGIRVYSSPKR